METRTLNRRNFLNTSTSAATAAAVIAGTGIAFGKEHERKREHAPASTAAAAAGGRTLTPAQAAAYDCLKASEVCLDHCLEALSKGDTSLASCQRHVIACQSVCEAFIRGTTADLETGTLKKLASACAAVCRDCAKACEEHKDHHAECRACMDACLACAKACEAV